MNSIERVLEEISIAEVEPDEELVRNTRNECKKIIRNIRQAGIETKTKKAKLTVRLLAAASVVAFIFVAFIITSINNQSPLNGAAYYTIDINPSFGFSVDENNVVLDVTMQNEDAKQMYEGIDCVGMDFLDAVKLIVEKAMANGYIKEEGQTYVLLGQFLSGDSKEDEEETLNNLLAGLQADLGDNIHLIGVNGSQEDIEQAKELDVSPGILILCNMTGEIQASDDTKIEDVVERMPEYYDEVEFDAPVIQGTYEGTKLIINWNEIDFRNVKDEETTVKYKLIKGTTLDEVKEMKNVVASSEAAVGNDQITQFIVDIDTADVNTTMYYCLYVSCGGTSKLSNVLPVTVKAQSIEATPAPTSAPIGDEGASKISGSISWDKITLTWTGIDNERFDGYKVMYSYTDSTPVYGEDGCYYLEYITDASKTTGTYKLTSLTGYKEGRKFYFSITALYDNQETKVAGNVIAKTMPVTTTAAPSPTATPVNNEYPSTNISGTMNADSIYFSWGMISDERLEGYKLVYSFTDSTPAYDSSPYLRWITTASQTSAVVSLSELGASTEDRVCYFSITALYENHAVKVPGSTISFTIPGIAPEEYITPALSSAFCSEDNGVIYMNWSAVEHSQFQYYKVNFSFTNSSPSYGASGTQSFMTDSISFSKSAADLSGFTDGATVYMSVTAVYSGGQTTSNVKSDIVFPAPAAPVFTSAYSSETDGKVYLEWGTVSHSQFENFNVVYQISGGTAHTINVGSATSFAKLSSEFTDMPEGVPCTFYIEAVYTSGIKKASASKTVTLHSPPA